MTRSQRLLHPHTSSLVIALLLGGATACGDRAGPTLDAGAGADHGTVTVMDASNRDRGPWDASREGPQSEASLDAAHDASAQERAVQDADLDAGLRDDATASDTGVRPDGAARDLLHRDGTDLDATTIFDATPPAQVQVTPGADHYLLGNGLVFARAFVDGTLELGRQGMAPFVLQRDLEDHDIVCIRHRCDGPGPVVPAAVADALSTQQQVIVQGETCVRTLFEGLPVDVGGALQTTAITLQWDLCLRPGSDEIVVRLDALGEQAGTALDLLYFPYAPALDPRGTGYAVLPIFHGLMLPVGWIVFAEQWTSLEQGGSVLDMRFDADGMGWGMPFFGVVESDGRGLLAMVRDHANASVRVHQVAGGSPRLTTAWRSSLLHFTTPAHRELVYVPMANADHVVLAQRYRAEVVRRGDLVTLVAKRALRPNLQSLLEGALVHASTCYYDLAEQPPPHGVMYTDLSFDDIVQQANAASTVAGDPLLQAVLHVDGWGQRGYDNLHPDVVLSESACTQATGGSPDCGPCEWAGGWAGLARLATGLPAGWVLELHDNYRDIYLDAPSHGSSCPDCLIRWDGQLSDVVDAWAGGPNRVLCARQALGYLQRNLDLLAAHGVTPGGMYLDTFAGVQPDECYSTVHGMSAEVSLAQRGLLLDEVAARGMVVASEQHADWSVPHIDHVYWSNHLRHYDPESTDHRRRYADTFFPSPVGVPLPLVELVYHDALVVPWPVLDGDAEEVLLDTWLHAGVPQVPLTSLHLSRLRQRLAELRAVHVAVGDAPLQDHHFLDDRFMSEEILWGGSASTRSTQVNRDTWTVASSGIAGALAGPVALPVRYRVQARVLQAVYGAPDLLRLTIEWTAHDDLSGLPAQRMFLHAVRPDTGEIVGNGDHAAPQPTSGWTPGTTVIDGPVDLHIAQDGTFDIVTGLFDSVATGAPRVDLATPRPDRALLLGSASVVTGVSMTLDHRPRVSARLAMVRQVSDLQVEVVTEWQTAQALPPGLRVFLHACDGAGNIIANADHQAVVAPDQWLPGARRRERRAVFAFDAAAVPGAYSLVTGLFDPSLPAEVQRVEFAGSDSERRLKLGTLRLEGNAGRVERVRFCPAERAGCP
ncbi:MAG: hypothetical protein ABIJ09_16715 [Pseudomonadota bacterium]